MNDLAVDSAMQKHFNIRLMLNSEAYLEVVNTKGEVIGYAPRSEVHGNPSLIHSQRKSGTEKISDRENQGHIPIIVNFLNWEDLWRK